MSNRIARRRFLKNAAIGTATGTVAQPFGAVASTRPRRPNILFILADDMGYADISSFGSRHIETPHIDALARQGVLMRDAYANSPVCSPTRLALITGRYNAAFRTGLVEPFRAGTWGDGAIPTDYPTLPAVLRQAGYGTSLVGKWHLGATPETGPLAHGYDEFYGFLGGGIDYFTHVYSDRPALRRGNEPEQDDGYMTTLLADEAIAAMERHNQRDDPFFLSLHFNAPHWPWEGPEDFALGTHGGHHDGGSLQVFAEMVESLDRNIGRVLKALENMGMAEDTLVIFTSDNGGERFSETWPLRGHKGYLLEGGIRVPTIVRFPGRVPAGTTSEQMAITMDWFPTILDAAGIAAPSGQQFDGTSLLPMLEGRKTVDRSLFWKFQGHRQRAARSGRWKYFRMEDNEFLYDLSVDTLERANRAEAEPAVLAMMKRQWDDWNKGMVSDDSILGYCEDPADQALALPRGEGTGCRP